MNKSFENRNFLRLAKPYSTHRQYQYLLKLAKAGATLKELEESCSLNFPLVWNYMLKGTDYAEVNTPPYVPHKRHSEI